MYKLHDRSRGSRSRWIGYRVPFALSLATLVGVAAVVLGSPQPTKPGLTATSSENHSQASAAPIPTHAQEAATVGICAKTTVPFKTIYNDSDQMFVGESKETGGNDGWVQTCKPDSDGHKSADVSVAPVDKVVTLGTLPRPAVVAAQPPAKKDVPAKNSCKQNFFQKMIKAKC